MHLLFCDNFLNPREPDEVYAAEFAAAWAAGFSCGLVSFEGLVSGEAGFARRAGGPAQGERVAGWNRGWMLRGEQYARLFAVMAERGIDLVVTSEAYAQAHYFPKAYPLVAEESPGTVWMEDGGDEFQNSGERRSQFLVIRRLKFDDMAIDHIIRCMKAITVNISEPVYREFQAYSKRVDRKTSELIREAMELYRRTHMERGASLRDRRPATAGGPVQPVQAQDDILGDMLDAARN